MNIEEAKANIGKEVVLLEDTKPYTWEDSDGVFTHTEHSNVSKLYGALRIVSVDDCTITIKGESKYQEAFCPHHIALKEPKMQNYKIKVANEAESKEAQELFFGLGYKWLGNKQNTPLYTEAQYLYGFENSVLGYGSGDMVFKTKPHQEITLPQLRDLAVLHRNDVGDATHKSHFVGHKFFVSSDGKAYEFHENKWQPKMCKSFLELITQEEQMTWQDALRAVADGKEVEIFIGDQWLPMNKYEHNQFRLAPQRKELNGKFTKEEILKIAGEMA